MRAGTTLETERLDLRPVSAQDAEALHALFGDPYVRRFLWDDVAPSFRQVADLVAASERAFAERGFGHFALRERGAAEPAPLVGLCGLAESEGEVELLYALAPSVWRRGYATEAGRAVVAFGFERAGLAQIVGRTDPPNHASARVLERVGMRFQGERPGKGGPLLHYAVSREAFLAARARGA